MPMDRRSEPWSDATYRGFAAPNPEPPDPREPRRRLPSISRNQLIAGAAVAVALGLLFGFWARPTLKTGAGAQTDLAAPARAVPIEVEHPAPQPQPRGGKLDVLPQAPTRPARVEPPPTFGPVTPPPATAGPSPSAPAPIPAPGVARAASPPPLAVPPPPAIQRAQGPRASFDCATARPGAEEMVCSDPGLAAADRELSRAYRRALASGAPPGAIRADQRDWIAIREDAARHSRRALADVYQQRIEELNNIADDGGPSDDDDGPGY